MNLPGGFFAALTCSAVAPHDLVEYVRTEMGTVNSREGRLGAEGEVGGWEKWGISTKGVT